MAINGKSLFVALTCLAASIALAPAVAFADSELSTAPQPSASAYAEADDGGSVIARASFVNPLYSGIIDTPIAPEGSKGAPLNLGTASTSDAKYFEDPHDGSVSDYLTECMKNRQRTISIKFESEGESDQELIEGVFDGALSHTGGANAGDYLRYQFGSWSYEASLDEASDGTRMTTATYTIDFFTTAAQERQVDQKVSEIVDQLSLNDLGEYECIYAIYQYITSHVTYDYANLNNNSKTLKYTAYAALFNGTAVCQGYTALFYRIANECHISARIIGGTTDKGEQHAWNIAQIWDVYYNLDCTWDAGERPGRYSYFLKCDANFPNHHRDAEYSDEDFYEYYPMSDKDYLVPHDFSKSKTYTSGYYSYKVSPQGSALITAYSGKEKNIVVPAKLNGYPVYAIGDRVFGESCTAETITLREGIQGWLCGGGWAFAWCPNLKTLNLPSTVGVHDGSEYDIVANSSGIHDCPKLSAIRVASGNPNFAVVNNVLFTKDLKTLLYYPSGATASSYTVPNGTVDIEIGAFAYQRHLTSVKLPNSLDTIGYNAFENAEKLSSVVIPDSCTFIGGYAFFGTALKTINIPANVEYVVAPALAAPTLQTISVSASNPYYFAKDGVLFSKKTYGDERVYALECYPAKRPGSSYVIPDGVTDIAMYAFDSAAGLKSVTFPSTLKTIESFAFSECTSLQSATLSQGLARVGEAAFFNCLSLKSLYIPDSVTEIGENLVANNETVMIFGPEGSAAQTIARAEGYKFVSTGSAKPGEIPQKVTLPATAYTKTYGDKAFGLGAATSGDGALKYSSSNTAVATVDSAGKVTIKGAGTATISVYAAASGICKKSATRTVSVTVKKAANPLSIKAKTATVKYSKVKAKTQKLKASKVIKTTKKGQGKMAYTKAKGNKKISIAKKTGKVTIKKGLAKGTYKVKVKVKAAGNKNYKASKVKTITFKIRIK